MCGHVHISCPTSDVCCALESHVVLLFSLRVSQSLLAFIVGGEQSNPALFSLLKGPALIAMLSLSDTRNLASSHLGTLTEGILI